MKKEYDFLVDERYGFLDGTPVEYMTEEKSQIAQESLMKIREFVSAKGKRPSELTEKELQEFYKGLNAEVAEDASRSGL